MLRFAALICLVLAAPLELFAADPLNSSAAPAQEIRTDFVIPHNGGFERGLEAWKFRPGDESQVAVVDAGKHRGQVLKLKPSGRMLGVETTPLILGEQIHSTEAYRVRADLKFVGLESGIFAFSMYCFDGQGKSLKQISFYPLNSKSPAHDWREVRGAFGPGTPNPLPAGTHSIRLRFSFYHVQGDCHGEVDVDNVVLEAFEPPQYQGWPKEITADVGDLQVRFESRSFWTLYRIDYKTTRLGLDRWGSHYGSVIRFPGVGFIGSGHTENEDEQILELSLWADGKRLEPPPSTIAARELKLTKQSRIRDFLLTTEIEIHDNQIVEDVRLIAETATPVSLIYHFMHPWTATATDYLAELPDGSRVEGAFQGDAGQRIDQAVRWSAIYDASTGKGVVTYVDEVPLEDDWRTRYWDLPERYRKHYLTTFLNRTVPADQEFHYRVVNAPFEADSKRWHEVATELATQLAAHCQSN